MPTGEKSQMVKYQMIFFNISILDEDSKRLSNLKVRKLEIMLKSQEWKPSELQVTLLGEKCP